MAVAAVALFVVYALNFFYYFVDDEAIPYVYAQNILHGKGLSYSSIEGPVEGYSDFLHVWIATLILAFRNGAGLPKIAVFFAGKALSFGCGIGIVLLAWHTMRRLLVPRWGVAAGLATVALAGPLAVWSCSSLETVPFALTLSGLAVGLIFESNRTAAITACVLVLLRIDGFIYAGVIIAAFVAMAGSPQRRAIVRRVALPVVLVLLAYHAWRVAYFRDVLPAPLRSKILYKLLPHGALLVKAPDTSYLSGFISVYGWWTATAFVAIVIYAVRLGGLPRTLVIAALPLVMYVAAVGDWMFGFRFFVALLPVFALIVALAVGRMSIGRPRLAAALSMGWIVAMGVNAERFVHRYTQSLALPSFIHAPSRDLHLFFRPYYGFYELVRGIIPPGEITAYNQAGLLPFLLDVNNIDDFGLCSRFYAALPSTDVYFTEGGRYTPLTNEPRLRVHQAYLVYRNAQFVLSGTDILRRANGNAVPSGLLGDYFRLDVTDAARDFAVYRRTDKPAGPYATDAGAFVENLAHVSYLRRASIDGLTVDPAEYARRFPFLHDGAAGLSFTGAFSMDVQFASRDESVRGISIDNVRVTERAILHLTLLAAGGGIVQRFSIPMEANESRSVYVQTQPGTTASRLVAELSSGHGVAARARIGDLRVEGQTPALAAYIAQHLRFPAPSIQR
jgi:hypothetical protein